MTRRVPCPVCRFIFDSNLEVFEHAKQRHPAQVANYLGTNTNGSEFVTRQILHSPDNQEPDSTCADGSCPCWERKLRQCTSH